MNNIKIATELLKIAKELTAASSLYGWNNPDDKVQIFADLLGDLIDALKEGNVKSIEKALKAVQNYGKSILLTKKLHYDIISILAEIEEAMKDEEFDGEKIAKEIEEVIKEIVKTYF